MGGMGDGVTTEGRRGTAASSEALATLHRVFGYDAFRGEQEAIIEHVVGGGDALVLMPTGGGKSLCYQIPALVRPGIGRGRLAADRADAGPGGRAAGARRAGRVPELHAGLRRAARGRGRSSWPASSTCSTSRRSGCALDADAATCSTAARSRCSPSTRRTASSQWGHDFRPDYLALSVLRRALARRAADRADRDRHRTPRTQEITQRLSLPTARHFVASFDRPNIQYRIVPKADPTQQLLDLPARASTPGDAGIVYCLSRNVGGEDRRVPVRATASRRCRTTPAWTRGPAPRTSPASCARTAWCGGDHRLRHGHRQAGRPLRRPPGPAEVRRGLLPGDRPRRPRRAAVHRLAGLRPAATSSSSAR